MEPRRILLVVFFILSTSATAIADGWTKDWTFYWPETVGVHFENNRHHQWTAKEKRRALRAMDGYLWSKTKKASTPARRLLWFEEVSDGKRFALIEKPSKLVEVSSRSRAHVVIRVQPLGHAGQTTLPTAGLPVTTTISSSAFREYVWILVHEAQHLSGADHPHA